MFIRGATGSGKTAVGAPAAVPAATVPSIVPDDRVPLPSPVFSYWIEGFGYAPEEVFRRSGELRLAQHLTVVPASACR